MKATSISYVKDFISLLLGIYFLLAKNVLRVHPLTVTSVVVSWAGDLEKPSLAFCDVLASPSGLCVVMVSLVHVSILDKYIRP